MKASEIPHPTEEQKAEYDRFIKTKADQPDIYKSCSLLAYHYTNADVLETIVSDGLKLRSDVESKFNCRFDPTSTIHQKINKVFFTTIDYLNIGHIPFWMWRSKLQRSTSGHIMEDYGRGCARIGVLQAGMNAVYPQVVGFWFTRDQAVSTADFLLVEFYSPEQDKWLRISHEP